ncbi:hypothetical protein TrST_g6011 [Triparma strigata]|uniref:Uncharacterized protein n=1 Tax=Triparma strigata TaxID=1606541 RepID=A0A9W7ECP5_9STRA|nr:hypothetical protein TrST_g6011 [Triparma strigata]
MSSRSGSPLKKPKGGFAPSKPPVHLSIDSGASVPDNSIYHKFRPDSTPKRAIRDEHSLVKERINSIVNTYSDYAENGALPSSSGNTTRYQLDSLFEDFESMAKGKDETLDMVHENLKRSEAVGTEMLKNVEEEVARSGGETMKLSRQAKGYLESSLSKLAECMKHNKQLSIEENKIQDSLHTITSLEKDVEKHLMALGNKSKEFDKFRKHTSSKIIGLKENYDQKLEDLMVELRDAEIKFEESESKNKEYEKQVLAAARRRSVINFSDIPQQNDSGDGWGGSSPKENKRKSLDGVPTSDQYHQKIRTLEAQLAAKEKEVVALKLDLDHHEQEEMARAEAEAARAKVKKTFAASSSQTDKPAEADLYPLMKATEDPFNYIENFLATYNHPDPSATMAPFRDLKSAEAASKKENSELMRKNRVMEKKLEDAIKTAEKSKKAAAAAAATPAVATGPDEETLKKLKQLEMKLKDAESSNSALKQSLDSTAAILSSTTDKLSASNSDLASEKMKAAGLAVLIKTKELASTQNTLKDQKEALDDLLADTSASESEEKAKYIALMKELDAKLEEVNKQQAAVSEQKMLLHIKNQELETQKSDLDQKQTNLDESLESFKAKTSELAEREEHFASQEATLNKKLEAIESAPPPSDAPSASVMNQINALKEQLAEYKSLQDSEDDIQKKKDALFEQEAEMEMKEQQLKARKDEYEKSSNRLSSLEQELQKLEQSLQEKQAELDTKTKELEEAQQAYESAQKTLDEAKIQNPVDPLDDIEIQTPALEPPPPTAASLGGPSSHADLDLIAVLTEEVEALKAEVATLNSIIDSKKAPGSAKSDRPTTTHEELRSMNKDYEEQMNNMTKLRAELENRKSELDSREVTLNERTKNVEDHLASELQRVQELTTSMTGLAPPGEISNLSFDWYNPDFKSHPNQFLAFLTMVENWVSGIKTKTYLQKDSNVTDIKDKNSEPETLAITLEDKHVSPMHAIFELHQTALPPPLRRKLQHIILQVEKFGGIFTPLSTHANMCNDTDDLIKEVRRHLTMIEELEIEVIAGEKQVASLIKQNQTSPMMNWATVRKAMGRWAEKLEFFGRIVGRQVALQNRSEEMRELQTAYIKAVQENCSEKEVENLDILGMATLSDSLLDNVKKAESKLKALIDRKNSINEQVSVLVAEYERVTARDKGNELSTAFDPKFSDVFINPDDDLVDPLLVKELRDQIEDLTMEIENLKSDKYEKMMEGDGSYGGLMFFAFLQESHFEEKLGRIVSEVTELHDSSHGKGGAHLSFSELQKMVDHIMKVRMPLLVKIKNRYGKLHKKWQSERMRRMKDMGLSGGEGDVAAVCPICNVDKRNVKIDRREGAKPLNGGTGQLSKKIEKPVKMVSTTTNVMKFSQKWKRDTLHKKNDDDGSVASNATQGTRLAMSASDGALGFGNNAGDDDSSQSSFSKTMMNSPAARKVPKTKPKPKPKPTEKQRVARNSKERLELALNNSNASPAPKKRVKEEPRVFDDHEQTGWDQGNFDDEETENSFDQFLEGPEMSPMAVKLPNINADVGF